MATFPISINSLAPELAKRNLSAEEGIQLDLRKLNTRELQDIFGLSIPAGVTGTALPYHDLDGSPVIGRDREPFIRYRLDGAVPADMGKYRQRRGTGLAAYLPRIGELNWVEIAHDTSVPVMITEGEYKSIAVCKLMPCIGLGGVDNWREKSGAWARPLDNFQWLGRQVSVCYDADKESTQESPYKPQVEGAARRIAARLFESGAEVEYVYIARTEVFRKVRALNIDAKMGIDDFLEAGGKMEELLATRDPASQDAIMARLLREYAVFMGGKPHIIRVADGAQYRRGEFTDVVEAGALRHIARPKGGVVEVRVADEWLKSQERNEVFAYVFKPGEDAGYDGEARTYNIWNGFAVEGWSGVAGDDEGAVRYRETVRVWKRFIGGLFGEHADYFEKWVAHMFQRPGEKTTVAVILCSVLTGVGKSLLGEVVRGMIGNQGSVAVALDRLGSNFNRVLERKLFVQMDEAEGTFLGMEGKLDDLITADTVVIEPKGFDAYAVANYARLFLTSNSTRPIRMKAENRRWLVISPALTWKDAKGEWGEWVRDVVAKLLKSDEGLKMLRWHLDRVDLTAWVPTERVPVTEAMMDMVDSARTKSGSVVDGLWNAFNNEAEDGIWALTGELRAQDHKVWGDLLAMVKTYGGQTLRHQIKVKGKNVKMTIIDREGHLPRKQDAEKKWLLDNSGSDGARHVLGGEQVQEAMVRTQKAFTEHSALSARQGSDKY